MDFMDCIKFANENPVTYIATIDGDQPRVRAFAMWYADETGFYYHTGDIKPVCQQLKANPNVELCFFHPGADAGTMMRVTGCVEFIDDTKLRGKLVEERPFLKAWGYNAESKGLVVFRVAKGEATFWSMKTNFDPKVVIKFG
ncbi:MAG: pyridoxamine 5'-phosphate oxidase family protein [Candidatus Bathyarchaeia archaeon]|jgi:uncharacterized pyridoxamine 5'-phosphate oxidase family protein